MKRCNGELAFPDAFRFCPGLVWFEYFLCKLLAADFRFFQVATLVNNGYRDVLGKLPSEYWKHVPSLQPLDPGAIPCFLFGDECNALGHSYMVITWMSEVTPKSQDSWFSRHLITLIPVEHYYIHDKQNLTLMAVMEVIANCFNALAQHGVQGIHLELVGIKGDWKWHKQVACLDRYYGTNFCCHLCACTNNLTMPFTDISESADWKATISDLLNPPWPIDNPPTICKM